MKKSISSSETIKQAWIRFLSSQQWTFFVTLTTGYSLGNYAARSAAERFYSRIKASGLQRMFWVAEPFSDREGYHIHLLAYSTPRLHPAYLIECWQIVSGGRRLAQNNRVDIQVFDPLKGASHYVAKHIQCRFSDYDIYDISNSTLWDK